MTVSDLVTASLTDLGVLAEGEVPTAAQAQLGFDKLNRMVDRMAADRLQIYALVATDIAIVPSQASYTVGTGGNFNIARPMFMDYVSFWSTATTPAVVLTLDPLTDDLWNALPVPALTSAQPTNFYWQPSYPLGKLWLYPIPTGTTLRLGISVPTAIAQFAALTTTVALPPGYASMLVSNLAINLAGPFGVQVSPSVVQEAQESMALVKRSNQTLEDLQFDPAALIGNGGNSYDIRTG